jgi:hypothetical protein
VPFSGDPTSVLRSISTNPLVLAGRLTRYDAPTQQEIFYQPTNSIFGNFMNGDGYRFRVDPGEEQGAARFGFTGFGIDFADSWLSLPRLGATRIGMPFPFSLPWESLVATDGIETKGLRLATKSTPPWFDSVAEYWNNSLQIPQYLGLAEDARDSTLFEPWRGYWVTSSKDNIALIAPTLGAPGLDSLAPNGTQIVSRGISIFVTGTNFRTDSTVLWNGVARPTTYLSMNRLRVDIPPSDLTTERTVNISVVSPAKSSAPASAPVVTGTKPFYVTRTPRLVVSNVLSMARINNVITMTVEVMNQGGVASANTVITSGALGTVSTTTALPNLGRIEPGAVTSFTMSFPGGAGLPGSSVVLRLAGTYTGGSFTINRKVTLP